MAAKESPRAVIPPPVALARSASRLDGVRVPEFRAESKWDGWRAVYAGGRLWSRHGTDLTGYFHDVVAAVTAHGAPDVVLDGELVCWDAATGLTEFAGLSRR